MVKSIGIVIYGGSKSTCGVNCYTSVAVLVVESFDSIHGLWYCLDFRGALDAHSAALVSDSLGEFCPLDTERGYHVGFGEGSERLLTRAVCDPSVGWIASPMAGGLRVAGKDDFVIKTRNAPDQVRLKRGQQIEIGWLPSDCHALDA